MLTNPEELIRLSTKLNEGSRECTCQSSSSYGCSRLEAVNPWTRLPPQPPFLLAEDSDVVKAHNSRRKEILQFRLDTLPEPFMGPLNAPVILLNVNPGFHPSDLINYALEL